MFVPHFTHNDLLRLSECCKGLMGYRHHLSRIPLTIPKPFWYQTFPIDGTMYKTANQGKTMEGLARMLAAQERGDGRRGLDCLVVNDCRGLEVLEKMATSSGYYCRVRRVELHVDSPDIWQSPVSHTENVDVGKLLSSILLGGCLPGIEDLVVNVEDGLGPVLDALKEGACPDLLRLNVNMPEDDECKTLAAALKSGHLYRLQELELFSEDYDDEPRRLRVIFQALQEGSCPNLTKLDLDFFPISPRDAMALANLLRSRACSQLKALVVSAMEVYQEGSVAVIEALRECGYSDLTRLNIKGARSDAGAAALSRLLASGSCPHLQEF